MLPMLFNCGVMATVGSTLAANHGSARFLRLLGVCAAGSALAAAVDMRSNPLQTQAGGLGMTAGLLTYTAFHSSGRLAILRLHPMAVLSFTLLFAFANNDKAVLGGTSAGYLAFLLAL